MCVQRRRPVEALWRSYRVNGGHEEYASYGQLQSFYRDAVGVQSGVAGFVRDFFKSGYLIGSVCYIGFFKVPKRIFSYLLQLASADIELYEC